MDHKCLDYLLEHTPDRAGMEKALQKVTNHPSAHALHSWCSWQIFFAPDADGRTCCQRWEKAGFPGLKGDQQLLLRGKMQTRIALLEIHRVLDGEQVEAVDLLSPGAPPMRFQDRSLASMAVRFACALTWIYPLPHYWRLSGTAVLLPEMAQFSAEEIVMEIVRHVGGPTEVEALRRWLAENLVRFDDALQATDRMRRMRMIAGLDARFGKAVYELRAPFATCRQRLDEVPDVELDDLSDAERQEGFAEARVWFTELLAAKKAVPTGGRAVLGRVLLGQSHWRLEAFGGEGFADLRRRFEQCLGDLVKMTGERIDNLGASLAAKEPAVNESIVPPRLLEDPEQILMASSRMPLSASGQSPEQTKLDLELAADRAFLDDQVPALDDKTPREAAADPALRPRLIRLLKQRVRHQDERNLASGRTDDLNWMLRELGTTEILFDPPPWRPPPPAPGRDDDSPDDDFFASEADPNLPPAPPLPGKPLSLEAAARRLEAGMEASETAAEAEATLHASGLTLIEDAGELTEGLLSDEEFSWAVPFLLQVGFVLVPPGHRAPPLDFDDLEQAFRESLSDLEVAMRAGSPKQLQEFPQRSAQPNLLLLLMNEILQSGADAPKKLRPSPVAQTVTLALVRAAVDALSDALQRRSRHD